MASILIVVELLLLYQILCEQNSSKIRSFAHMEDLPTKKFCVIKGTILTASQAAKSHKLMAEVRILMSL